MGTINTTELGNALARRRAELGISLREIGEMTGISASTLSRIEHYQGQPDARVVASLTAFLNIPIDRVIGIDDGKGKPVVYYPTEPTPEIVRAYLNADPTLSPKTVAALAELFHVAYNTMKDRP